jgi:hypothetical protein
MVQVQNLNLPIDSNGHTVSEQIERSIDILLNIGKLFQFYFNTESIPSYSSLERCFEICLLSFLRFCVKLQIVALHFIRGHRLLFNLFIQLCLSLLYTFPLC